LLAKLLAERMEHNGVGIVIGIVEPSGQRIIAYGKSGSRHSRPLDGDSVFQIGSITEMFTGLLLSEMVLRGEVHLTEPVSTYLPTTVGS